MSSNYKVRLRRYNGNDYDVLNLSSNNVLMDNGNTVEGEIENISSNLYFVNKVYPVGSIYLSTNNNINPNILFTGTEWRLIEDRFLIGAGNNYGLNTKGGEASVKLTKNQLPSHTHGNKNIIGYFFSRLAQQGNSSYVWGSENENDVVYWKHMDNRFNTVGLTDVSYVSGTRTYPDFFQINASHEHETVGNNEGHNNIPPYLAVYMWERIR